MCWNKGRLYWKTAKLLYFCHLKEFVRPETFGPTLVYALATSANNFLQIRSVKTLSLWPTLVMIVKEAILVTKILTLESCRTIFLSLTYELRGLYLWRNSTPPPSPTGQGLLIIEASRSHSDAPHSVGLLWTSDQPDAETSTWQHSQQTSMPPAGFEPTIPASERPRTHWDRHKLNYSYSMFTSTS